MLEKNFILICDFNSEEIKKNLRKQLNIATDSVYNLTECSYSQAPYELNSKRYDHIFASVDRGHLEQQTAYLGALAAGTSTPLLILEQDSSATRAIAQMQRKSPNLELERISQKEIVSKNGSTEIISAFFQYSMDKDRENRLRSDARNEDNTKQWREISQLRTTVDNLVGDMVKVENHLWGGTSPSGEPNGIIATSAWVMQNRYKFDQMQSELRDCVKAIADLNADIKKAEEEKAVSWQTKLAVGLAVLGASASIGAAFVPIWFDVVKSNPKATAELVK